MTSTWRLLLDCCSQFTIFAAVGVVSTAIHTSVAFFIIYIYLSNALLANIIGYCFAAPVSYLGHSFYSFKQSVNKNIFIRFVKYNTILFITSVLVSSQMDKAGVSPYITTIVVVLLLPFASFLLHKYVTFT